MAARQKKSLPALQKHPRHRLHPPRTNPRIMTAEQLRSFYNTHFFEGRQAKEAHLVITFQAGERILTIPGVKAKADVTLETLFKAYHQYLLSSASDKNEDAGAPSPKVLDITIVTYRGKAYMLDVLEGDQFVVRRKEDGVVIKRDSPTARGVVKRYKNESAQDMK